MRRIAHPRALSVGGFSLIEVLVAMLVLATGLLAVQGLSAVAIRSSGLAERNSRAAATSTHHLEGALQRLRRGELPSSFACTLAGGDEVSLSVAVMGDPRLAVVEVRVLIEPRGGPSQRFTVVSHAYSPDGFRAAGAPAPCP